MIKNTAYLFLLVCLIVASLPTKAVGRNIHFDASRGARPLTIAVASNFTYTLEQLIASSDYWSKQNLRIVTGSSGTLYAQIIKGAPFDVFLSADSERPNELVKKGFSINSLPYARGQLVVWFGHTQPSYINNTDCKPTCNEQAYISLLSNIEGKLAIANPRFAPFGKAAQQVIQNTSQLIDLNKNLVTGANVTQAFQFVDSGNAQAGLIAYSLLIQAKALHGHASYSNFVLIPSEAHAPILQSLTVLKPQQPHAQAKAFADFLLSNKTQKKLAKYGYLHP